MTFENICLIMVNYTLHGLMVLNMWSLWNTRLFYIYVTYCLRIKHIFARNARLIPCTITSIIRLKAAVSLFAVESLGEAELRGKSSYRGVNQVEVQGLSTQLKIKCKLKSLVLLKYCSCFICADEMFTKTLKCSENLSSLHNQVLSFKASCRSHSVLVDKSGEIVQSGQAGERRRTRLLLTSCPLGNLFECKERKFKWAFPPLAALVHLVPLCSWHQTVPRHWVCMSLQSVSSFLPRTGARRQQPKLGPGCPE